MPDQFYAADVFAGGGGLTVGLKRAGFAVASAVEIEPHAYSTYKANHPETHAYLQDVRTVAGEDLKSRSPTGRLDLLAGCPPCQGFTSLTSKYRREDTRNELILQMARLVEETEPTIVMMENVPGLARRGKPLLDAFLNWIESLGYVTRWEILQAADYGVPQYRRRLVLFAGKGFDVELPEPRYAKGGSEGRKPWRTLRDCIGGMGEAKTLSEVLKQGSPTVAGWHVVRTLSEENRKRLEHALPGKTWRSIPEELRPSCHRGGYRGFTNVYGRMSWDDVSPTITAGCTTLSKGRFGHPEKPRTISLREAALLQTFPADYVFDTPYMEKACGIVGNALPCDFAEALARRCMAALRERDAA